MKKNVFSLSALPFLLSLILLVGCNRAGGEELQEEWRKEEAQISWEKTDEGTVITYGEKADDFYQITQLPFPTFWGGAAYSIITPKGDLYLVDGGFQGEDGERITQYIEANGGRVKGWILTHPHVDHIGAFLDYAAAHPDRIEKVYYSPFTAEFFEEEEDPEIYLIINKAILFYEFQSVQEATANEIEYIPMKTGDTLTLDKLKLECFASFDPERKDVNGNSLVFTLSYEDFTLLLTGDMTEATLTAMQETALKDASLWDVDIIQIPHHGYYGGITVETLYTATGAKLALLDCTKEEYDNNSAGIHNTVELLESLNLPYIKRFESIEGNKIFIYCPEQ